MSTEPPNLLPSTARPSLAQALQLKLERRGERGGRYGELEALAVRIGLIHNALSPRLSAPQLLIFAGDHGLAVDVAPVSARSSAARVDDILQRRIALPLLAEQQGLQWQVVDAGLATPLAAQPGLLSRKIAHGTRHCRMTQAMSLEQVNAAIRAGTEITQHLPGNVLGCAGLGVGSTESALLVISHLTGLPLAEIAVHGAARAPLAGSLPPRTLLPLLEAARQRHATLEDPVEILAAYGGFETAMMVGALLKAAEQQRLIMIDGLAACAALIVATHIAGPVPDYCVFCRSTDHAGLDRVMAGFQTQALLTLGLESQDGTGITLSWPLVSAAAALLGDLADAPDAAAPIPTTSQRIAEDAPGQSLSAEAERFRYQLTQPGA